MLIGSRPGASSFGKGLGSTNGSLCLPVTDRIDDDLTDTPRLVDIESEVVTMPFAGLLVPGEQDRTVRLVLAQVCFRQTTRSTHQLVVDREALFEADLLRGRLGVIFLHEAADSVAIALVDRFRKRLNALGLDLAPFGAVAVYEERPFPATVTQLIKPFSPTRLALQPPRCRMCWMIC